LRCAARHGCVQDAIVRGRPCCRQPSRAAGSAYRLPLSAAASVLVSLAWPPGLRDRERAQAPPRAPGPPASSPRPSGPSARRLARAVYLGCCWGTSREAPGTLHFLPARNCASAARVGDAGLRCRAREGCLSGRPPLHGARQAAVLARPASTVPCPGFRSGQGDPMTCTSVARCRIRICL
jgi:hypothetical protein